MTAAAPAVAPSGPPPWRPHPKQARFLATRAYEALFGGSAGPGKSESLLMGPLRYIQLPTFRAILFRRTFPELQKSLIDRALQRYKAAFPAAKWNGQDKVWRFPSGARIYFGHLEHDHDVHTYQSAEFQYIGFDELTSFSEHQYRYMLSRARSSSGIPIEIRAATNPGNRGEEWVLQRWGPWLDPHFEAEGLPRRTDPTTGEPTPAADPGQVLHYVNTKDGERWVPRGAGGALSRVFIPALLSDNPTLLDNDPGYEQRLMGMDRVSREQLLGGKWGVRAKAGDLFQASWFKLVDAAPAEAMRIRYWDRAATEPTSEAPDPDWTVGVRLALSRDGLYTVEDVKRFRKRPDGVMKEILATAEEDGRSVEVGIERDPGQAGKFEAAVYVQALAGYNVHVYPVTADKVTRAKPWSAQCEAGNVRMLRGAWNRPYTTTHHDFPDGKHDDDVDGSSGAFAAVTAAAHRIGYVRIARPSPSAK